MPKRSQKHASEDDSEVALDEEYEASEDAPSDDDSDYEEQPAKKGKKTPSNKENKPPAKSAKTPSSGAKPQEKVSEDIGACCF